jgi:hypothetical protein
MPVYLGGLSSLRSIPERLSLFLRRSFCKVFITTTTILKEFFGLLIFIEQNQGGFLDQTGLSLSSIRCRKRSNKKAGLNDPALSIWPKFSQQMLLTNPVFPCISLYHLTEENL